MPSMADLVVKKNDGTTNITWTAIQRSSGDSSPAIWREQTLTTMRGGQPTLQLWAKWSGNARDARRSEVRAVYPYVVSDGSFSPALQSVKAQIIYGSYLIVPEVIPTAYADEAIAQVLNLQPALKAGLQGGFSYV